jgi:hypothetical protein
MSQHPIDEVFRRKLEDHASEAPMHLWAKIDAKRNWKHKLYNQLRLRWFPIVAGAGFVTLALIGLFNYNFSTNKDIQSLPIYLESPKAEKSIPVADTKAAIAETTNSIANKSNTEPSLEKKQLQAQIVPAAIFPPHSNNYEENQDLINANQETNITENKAIAKTAEKQSATKQAAYASLASLDLLNPTLEVDLEEGLFKNDPECAKFSKGQIRIFAEILASPDFTFRQLDPKNPSDLEYAEFRAQTESPEYNFSTGLRFSAVSGFGLALRSGVNYSQISEKFEYINETEEVTTIIRDMNGNPIDTIVEMGTRYKTTYNKYRTLDIPILLGYEINYKKFTFALNGGAYLNLVFEQKGDFLSPLDYQPVNFSSNNPNAFPAFKDRLDIGWYGSLGIHYRITPRLQLLVEPHFKLYPKSFTQDNYIVDQKYFTTGVFFGIRHGI